ncbi:MAG TPA: hypothetical protein VFN67_36950 [Polyangiales bacterium]|nr:hypothetical protein [Polyangiales bacterium]
MRRDGNLLVSSVRWSGPNLHARAVRRPPVHEGFFSVFPAGARPEPLLKEVWVNGFWEPDARFTIDPSAPIPVDQALTIDCAGPHDARPA